MAWVYLLFAILLEIAGTVSLKLSQGFTKMIPSVLMVAFYLLAFFNLSLSLKQVPISVAYAIWSGLGTAAVAIIGYMYFQETMTPFKVVSICLIVLGVIGLNFGGGTHGPDQPGISN
ncbi:DMT family transporter [Cohnella herbarum]|uniref:Multidrug efflux SMR transporter n=1 Tax=Cohnella herbarum TaxID=2728023 RepID=A0A7Z2VMG7_9BACL|nr:multidrug efflux SMR transporter [Cohnella herbarum]QJD85634.1 multidrug efflux SMR transporter [Cohnella herbarum]